MDALGIREIERDTHKDREKGRGKRERVRIGVCHIKKENTKSAKGGVFLA